jgi:outer membrane protein TolC
MTLERPGPHWAECDRNLSQIGLWEEAGSSLGAVDSARRPGPRIVARFLVLGYLCACTGPGYVPPDFKARERDFPAPELPPFALSAGQSPAADGGAGSNADRPGGIPAPQNQTAEALPGETPQPSGQSGSDVPADAPQATTLLRLDEVLESVYTRYPPYLSVLLETELASAAVQQALGAFDTNFFAKAGRNFTGFYSSTVGQALLEQPLWMGGSLYGGYRISDGLLPDYYEARTQTGGELAVGGRFPLLRDREFDARRLKLRQEEIDQSLAEPRIAQGRVDFVLAATRTYNQWVAEGQRLRIARELLELATRRVSAINRGVERQFLAAIDRTDNERLIVQRQLLLVRAERGVQQASLALSLFLRSPDDEPIVPDPARLPGSFEPEPAPDWSRFQEEVEAALARRPELRRIELLIDRTRADQDLADNQLQPNLDLKLDASQDIDDSPYKDLNELELFAGLEFKLPIQRRAARGRLRQATTELERLAIERSFARDRVLNDIADALSAWQAAFGQLEQAQRNVTLAQELVQAEERAFELGRSDLLRINLRETQLADARIAQLEAQLAAQQAAATYRAALALDALPR